MKLVKTVNSLLLTASLSLAVGLTLYVPFERVSEPKQAKTSENDIKYVGSDRHSEKKSSNRKPNPNIIKESELRSIWQGIDIEYVTLELDYIGQHYITAYSPEECGYRVYEDGSNNFPNGWITSTGTIAHREEEWNVPSTCGIATDYHRYGELFLIDGKVYVAEDTGYISGAWIDLFMPDYETMMQFGSHYTDVYSVEFVTHKISIKERIRLHESLKYLIHDGYSSGRIPGGSHC